MPNFWEQEAATWREKAAMWRERNTPLLAKFCEVKAEYFHGLALREEAREELRNQAANAMYAAYTASLGSEVT